MLCMSLVYLLCSLFFFVAACQRQSGGASSPGARVTAGICPRSGPHHRPDQHEPILPSQCHDRQRCASPEADDSR